LREPVAPDLGLEMELVSAMESAPELDLETASEKALQ
jgi:hypothetical protein